MASSRRRFLPIWNAPAWGSLQAWACFFFTVLLVLYGPLITVPFCVCLVYGVTLFSAWKKKPAIPWRCFALISLALALTSGLLFHAWRMKRYDETNYLVFMDAVTLVEVVLATLVAGIPLLPIAIAVPWHTARTRRMTRQNGPGGRA